MKTVEDIKIFQKKHGLGVDGIIGPMTQKVIDNEVKAKAVNKWPMQSPLSMNQYYGNPDLNRDGICDPKWKANNLIKIKPPYQMYYPTENKSGSINKRGTKWSNLWVHKKCAESLLRILTEIPKVCTPDEIKKYELDLCGGTYVFRLKRSGTGLSIHSWGAAIDLSHLINRYKRPYNTSAGMMPQKVANIFLKEGWTWLKSNDAMHFQAASTV